MLRWRVEIADLETLGGSLQFMYNKGALHHVPDCLSRAPCPGVPELLEAEEELWIASKSLVQQVAQSVIVNVDAKARTRPDVSFHMPDTESIVAQILKWQNDDDYAQAGIKYCKDGEHPDKPYLQKWIKTVGEELELNEYGILC